MNLWEKFQNNIFFLFAKMQLYLCCQKDTIYRLTLKDIASKYLYIQTKVSNHLIKINFIYCICVK